MVCWTWFTWRIRIPNKSFENVYMLHSTHPNNEIDWLATSKPLYIRSRLFLTHTCTLVQVAINNVAFLNFLSTRNSKGFSFVYIHVNIRIKGCTQLLHPCEVKLIVNCLNLHSLVWLIVIERPFVFIFIWS